jgi:hypothetical protein
VTINPWFVIAGLLVRLVYGPPPEGVASSPAPRITKEQFDCIKQGMSQAEVEKIFGKRGWLKSAFCTSATQGRLIVWSNADGSSATIGFLNDAVHQRTWTDPMEPILEQFRCWYAPWLPLR